MSANPVPEESGSKTKIGAFASGCVFVFVAALGTIITFSCMFALFMSSGAGGALALLLAVCFGFLTFGAFRAAGRRLPRSSFPFVKVTAVVGGLIFVYVLFTFPEWEFIYGRNKQKKTIADLRAMGAALDRYYEANHSLPDSRTAEGLDRYLVPTYLKSLPREDAWKNAFRYAKVANADGSQTYFLGSAGRDKRWEQKNLKDYSRAATTSFDSDIIFSDGHLVQHPEGIGEP